MPTTITVTYPNQDGARFDLDYYVGTHLPLVEKHFKAHGLKGWRVLKAVGAPFGEPAYSVICTLEFDTGDQFRAAVAAEGEVVFGDVPNFTDTSPTVVIGDHVASA